VYAIDANPFHQNQCHLNRQVHTCIIFGDAYMLAAQPECCAYMYMKDALHFFKLLVRCVFAQ
jgi:hypothetical protein